MPAIYGVDEHGARLRAPYSVVTQPAQQPYWSLALPAVSAPAPNPLLRPPFVFQAGAYWPNLNGYPAAIDALFPSSQLPAGVPPHPNPRLSTVLRFCTNDVDAQQTTTQAPYQSIHLGFSSAGGVSPAILGPGHHSSAYLSYSILFDPSYPQMPGNDFQQWSEIFGPPFGSPAFGMNVCGAGTGVPVQPQQYLCMGVNETSGYWPWTMPFVRGQWLDFVWFFNFSTDPLVGSVSMWLNGQPQKLSGSLPTGVTRSADELTIYYPTLRDNTNPQNFYVDNYRTGSWAKQATTWVAYAAIGPTYDSVDPMAA